MTENEAIELHIGENLHRIEAIEEFLRTNSDANEKECKKNIQILTKINSVLQEIQQYRLIGTVEECREARERQREKKPMRYKETNRADCPMCGNTVRGISKPFGDWCSHCGQKLDWSDSQ